MWSHPLYFHNNVCGWGAEKIIWVSGRQNEKIEEGGCVSWDTTWAQLLFTLTSSLLHLVHFWPPRLQLFVSVISSYHPQMNSMNSVSSSEDIKPPPGLQNLGNINYQCTSPGGMSKHICSICGDRSSGNVSGWGGGKGVGKHIYCTLPPTTNIATLITEGTITKTDWCQGYLSGILTGLLVQCWLCSLIISTVKLWKVHLKPESSIEKHRSSS